MIAKIKRGSGFRGALNYCFNEGKNAIEGKEAELIGGNMTGTTAKELATEFKQCRKLRPEVSRPVWTESLRPEGMVDLTPEQWNELATGHMKAIGLDPDKHMHTIFQHPQENHIHIVASRIAIDGSLYLGKNENLIASKDCRRIEKEHGLQQLPERPTKGAKHVTKNEIEMKNRTGELPPREKLQNIISKSLVDRPAQPVFEKRLVDAGVSFKKSTGGYSYEIDGVAFKGSQLGKEYKQSAIQSKIAPPIITPPPVVEVKIKLPPASEQPQDIVVQPEPPKSAPISRPEVKIEENQEINQVPDTTRRGDPDQLQEKPVNTTSSELPEKPYLQQPAFKPELQSVPSETIVVDSPAPVLTAEDLRRIAGINREIARLNRMDISQIEYDRFYNRHTSEIKAIWNNAPGVRITIEDRPCPVEVNGQPITELVKTLPPEPAPAPTQGIKSGGRK